jgi:hypothetical protein
MRESVHAPGEMEKRMELIAVPFMLDEKKLCDLKCITNLFLL